MTAATWNLERGTWTIAGALLKRNKCLVTQRTRVLQVKWVLRWQDLLPSPSSARHFLIFRLGAHPKTARAFLKYPQSISLRGLPYLVRLHWRCTFVTLSDRSDSLHFLVALLLLNVTLRLLFVMVLALKWITHWKAEKRLPALSPSPTSTSPHLGLV